MERAQSKLTHAPVFYTLAAVQFNPVAQMPSYVAPLQERLRRSGFPDFAKDNQVGVTVQRLKDLRLNIQKEEEMRWIFTNAEQMECYVLLSDTLVFQTTTYDNFKEFLQKVLFGLQLVHEIVELAYVERVGLRYLNAIAPMGNDTIEQYLNPSLQGFLPLEDASLQHSLTETVSSVKQGTLLTRAITAENGLIIPPDLLPLRLKLQPRFEEICGRITSLDTDYSVTNTKRSSFDVETVERQLLVAKEVISNTFKASVTDHAIERWA